MRIPTGHYFRGSVYLFFMRLALLFLLSWLFLGPGPALAQSFEPGLLVRASGDTLRGEVENGFWVTPPEFIRFRATAASPIELLQPRQLRAVSFTGGRYFRYEALPIDHAAETHLSDLIEGNIFSVQVDSLLAEVLLTGPIELRRVVRPGAVHYLLRRPGQPWLSLSERQYLRRSATGSLQIVDGNNYHGQLELYFGGCPAAVAAARAAPFTAPGLAAVAQAYAAGCAAPGAAPVRSWLALAQPRRRAAFQAGVLGGVRYHLLESAAYQLAGEHTDGQLHPFGGFYAELLQPSRTTAIYGELSLSGFQNKGVVRTYNSTTGEASYTTFSYQAMLGTARLGIRYLMPLAHDQQFVLGLGLERNVVWGFTSPPAATANVSAYPSQTDRSADTYADPTLLPNLTLGWRQRRLTATLDAQLYVSSGEKSWLTGMFLGSNLAARFGLSYRLGRHPDQARAR
ncbi:hypothetical protein [Hymenobacter cheonanensis]|uniref:hypothetical protein n=1 Tax=Hymenobacter sp. CA2-7 TaxID=3063993 RepID=UPI002712833F|nr:hypothetical protein [Hymenobacter sp. CA2-7]MDO7884927.1 hypothetical protein [Hymenobacter sp. CA2-7]